MSEEKNRPSRKEPGGEARTTAGRPRNTVRPGVRVLLEERQELLRGKNFGLITNPTGVLPDLRHEVDVMAANEATRPRAILAPEHGFRGAAQAGDSGADYTDPKTGIPVYDIYGKNRDRIAALYDRAGIDTVVFDIQDAGARFYTYVWTMSDCMEAAAISGREFMVLDRPNPIGGLDADGPVLKPEYSTFVGRYPISQRHGMTVGELANMFNEEFVPGRTGGKKVEKLTVVETEGWRRGTFFEETGLPWVMPSPNMPTSETALVYPGTCMFEGTNLSEGRGTTRPFELIGAPYIDGAWADALREGGPPDATFREAYFAPTFSKHSGKVVGGTQIYPTGLEEFDPIRAALAMILESKRLYPDGFQWRYDSWDPVKPYWIDKLTGSDYFRTAVDSGKSLEEVTAGWQADLDRFRAMRNRYLIYGGR